jgi:hypothetical protein
VTRCAVPLVAFLLVLAFPAVCGAQRADPRETLLRASALLSSQRSSGAQPSTVATNVISVLDEDSTLSGWDWVREPLTTDPPDLVAAEQRLKAAAAAEEAARGNRDPVAARAALVDVLADPRFHPEDWHALVPSWLVPFIVVLEAVLGLAWRIMRWPIDRLLDGLAYAINSPIIIVVALVAVAGIVLLYRTAIRATLVRQAEIDAPTGPLPVTATEALEKAHQQANLGRYRDACHFIFLSTLLWIEEHSETRFDPSATNREHLRRAQMVAGSSVSGMLAPVVNSFDHLWYGADAVTESDYRNLVELAGHVRAAVA